MKFFRSMAFPVIMMMALISCNTIFPNENNPTPTDVFDELWEEVDQKYVCFSNKDLDWDAVYEKYRVKVNEYTNEDNLFAVALQMLEELEDGHVALSTRVKRWSGYQREPSVDFLQEASTHYLGERAHSSGGLQYSIIKSSAVGYIRYDSFTDAVSESHVNEVLTYCKDCQGLILDLRENAGGELANAITLLDCLPTDAVLYKTYIRHNAVHDELVQSQIFFKSDKIPEREKWYKPFIVLIDGRSFSASSIFAMCAKSCENVRIVGVTSAGGTNLADYFELSNGWIYRIPNKKVISSSGLDCENGILPDVEVHLDHEMAENENRDNIIETACEMILSWDQ